MCNLNVIHWFVTISSVVLKVISILKILKW